MVLYKSYGPSEEPLFVLEFLIRDYCVEGVVPERGGDSKTLREKWRLHWMHIENNRENPGSNSNF